MKRSIALLLLLCLLLPSAALAADKLPKVKFPAANVIGAIDADLVFRMEITNAGNFSGAKTLELRDQSGRVWMAKEYKVGQAISFTVHLDESFLGGYDLSVWCEDTEISLNSTYVAVSDKHRKAASIPGEKVATPNPWMSVTLDCCYTDPHTDEILAVLDKYNVKATFFMAGEFLLTFPETAKKIRDAGHEIAAHSLSHPHLLDYHLDMRVKQVRRNAELIREILGVNPRLFRPPFGEFDYTISAPARAEGMEMVLWSIDSHDWDWQFAHVVENVVNRVSKDVGPGTVILFHLDGWNTAQVLDRMIPYYQNALGLKLVTVSELLVSAGIELPPLPYNALPENAEENAE